jgi:hypothetical protein
MNQANSGRWTMKSQIPSVPVPAQLSRIIDGLIVHQALYAAAKLGVADLLSDGPQNSR